MKRTFQVKVTLTLDANDEADAVHLVVDKVTPVARLEEISAKRAPKRR